MNKSTMAKYLVGGGMSIAAALGTAYLIVPSEGSVKNRQGQHVVYLDAVNIPTACYGQTGKDYKGRTIKLGMTYSEEECLIMLESSVKKFEAEVDKVVKVNYASDYQKASLISFTYNVGIGNLQSSTLLKRLNSGQHKAACDQLSAWVYAQKRKLGGLVTRRELERQWCMGEVPYEVKVTFNETVDLVRRTTETSTGQEKKKTN